jgi:dTDP-4-amino-4,6-dideoxygalactose transaminase
MIPFSPPRIDQKIIDAVSETLRSGWITTGPKTKLLEKKLTEFAGHKVTLCVSSATAGLELMLRWYGVQKGDEVIVPAYTYSATVNVIVHCGAKPVLVDISDDFDISVEAVEKAITARTKVIIPVDLAGYPCDYDKINALVVRSDIQSLFVTETPEQQTLRRILVLSDSAHSIGAWYKGKRAGSLTDVSVFSFHAVKNLTTAEGGAICFNLPEPFDNQRIYDRLNVLSLHGQDKDALAKTQTGNWRYDIVEPGYKANMTDIMASMGLVELERYDGENLVRRKHIFDQYKDLLSRNRWAQIPEYENENRRSSYHVFLLRIRGITETQRDKIIQKIFDQKVSVNVHFIPLPMLTYYRNAGYRMSDFPVSYDSYSREISLPVYYDLTDEQVSTVAKAVIRAVEEVVG